MRVLLRELAGLFEAAPQIIGWSPEKGFKFQIVGHPGGKYKVYAKGGRGKEHLSKSTHVTGWIEKGLGDRWYWNDGLRRSGSEDRRGSKTWEEAAYGLLKRRHRRLVTKGKRYKGSDPEKVTIDFLNL